MSDVSGAAGWLTWVRPASSALVWTVWWQPPQYRRKAVAAGRGKAGGAALDTAATVCLSSFSTQYAASTLPNTSITVVQKLNNVDPNV